MCDTRSHKTLCISFSLYYLANYLSVQRYSTLATTCSYVSKHATANGFIIRPSLNQMENSTALSEIKYIFSSLYSFILIV